jgi:holo-[acyl-carrier protein] synthase
VSRHEIGIDLVDIDRIVAVLDRHPDRFRHRVLTDPERRYCGQRVERIAGRWAAKEAISKVLGLGVRGVGWREIEILPNRAGAPIVTLHARAARRAAAMGLDDVTVSISHERRMAVAVAVAHRPHGPGAPSGR